jgi:Cdc6-like AAA superfamily ATPase
VPRSRIPSNQDFLSLEYQVKATFSPSAPIGHADAIAGRRDQIRRLIDAVLENGKHAALFGERGVGKTSVANTFHEMISGVPNLIIPIRKQASPYDTFNDLWRKVFRDLKYEISENGDYGRETTTSLTAADVYQDDITQDDVIRALSKKPTNANPVIIFDEFDLVTDQKTRSLMSHTIKALTESVTGVTVIFVGIARDVEDLVAEHRSVERNLAEIKMPRMSKDEMNEILDKRLPPLGIKLEGDARWKIVALARGLPEYVHYLGREAAVRALQHRRLIVREEDVGEAITLFLKDSDRSSYARYRKAIDSNKTNAQYKQILVACALTKTADEDATFAPRDVIEPASMILGHKVEIANFQGHLNAFSSSGRGHVLERSGSPRAYRYKFAEPKMQPYVIMQGISDGIVSRDALSVLATPEQPRLSSDF